MRPTKGKAPECANTRGPEGLTKSNGRDSASAHVPPPALAPMLMRLNDVDVSFTPQCAVLKGHVAFVSDAVRFRYLVRLGAQVIGLDPFGFAWKWPGPFPIGDYGLSASGG